MKRNDDPATFERPRPTKSPTPAILFQDEHLAVVNKPANVWPREGVFDEPGVWDLIPESRESESPPVQVTPLEFDVSGCAIYAFRGEAADALRRQFADCRAGVTYDCVVNGPLLSDSGEIEARVPASLDGGAVNDAIRSDPAVVNRTTWRLLDTFVAFARIECTPAQPVESQVRFHLQHAGMPLAVDPRFGGANLLMLSSFKAGYRKSRRHVERPLIQRPSLHAKSVAFKHPATGESLSLDADFAKDYKALLHQLERFGRVPR